MACFTRHACILCVGSLCPESSAAANSQIGSSFNSPEISIGAMLYLSSLFCGGACLYRGLACSHKGRMSCRLFRHSRRLAVSRNAEAGSTDSFGDVASPGHMLRSWRRDRREQLAPAIYSSWCRTDSLPRGRDAGFQFQNVGPLVGCPPSLWVYFVSGADVPRVRRADRTQLLFKQSCDTMMSYSLLNCSAGTMADAKKKDSTHEGMETFDAANVFKIYDLVVACDAEAKRAVESAMQAAGDTESSQRLCCLADFLDMCDESVQIEQLRCLLSPPGAPASLRSMENALAGKSGQQLASNLSAEVASARRAADLAELAEDSAEAETGQALAAAGLERYLISVFPKHLKDRLHPYLMPEGL